LIGRRPDIDGLRAIAVLSVLLFHAGLSTFSGGFVGVDVFFVISGYLITGIIVEDCRKSRFSFVTFYTKRIRRIFPALILVLIATLVAGWFFLLPSDFAAVAKQALAGSFFVPNFLFWNEAGYFDKAAELKPLLHLWSLGIEEQFYFIWPAAIYLVVRNQRSLISFLLAITIGSFAYCVFKTIYDPVFAFYIPLTRIWELSLGALVAVANRTPSSERMRSLLSAGGLTVIGVAVLTFSQKAQFPGALAAIPTLGAAAVIWAGEDNKVSRNLLAAKPVSYIGLVSYPLYLWHWPIISFSHLLDWQLRIRTIFAVSLVLAVLTYELIEKTAHRIDPRRISRVLVPGMITAAAISLPVIINGGFYNRYPADVVSILKTMHYDYGPDGRFYECWLVDERARQDFPPECTSPNRSGGILIVGDSHAARIYPGIARILKDAPVWQITRSSCLPMGGRPLCDQTRDYALKIASEQKPKYVILYAAWSNYSSNWDKNSKLGNSLGLVIDKFSKAGSQVIVLGPAPKWEKPLPLLAFKAWGKTGKVPSRARDVETVIHSIDLQIREIAEIRGAWFISVNDHLCNERGCLVHVPSDPGALISWDTGASHDIGCCVHLQHDRRIDKA